MSICINDSISVFFNTLSTSSRVSSRFASGTNVTGLNSALVDRRDGNCVEDSGFIIVKRNEVESGNRPGFYKEERARGHLGPGR